MLEIDLSSGGWFDGLPAIQSNALQMQLDGGKSEEEVAESCLSNMGSQNTAGFGAGGPIQTFYSNVKQEFISFVCGGNKYEEERIKARDIWQNQGKVALVSFIAAVVASTVGLAAAAVVPVVALLLSLASKIGLNAFCASCDVSLN